MERYVCIHGHFYQPPRENPWLETVELQDSAYPYHDWNERITAECYAPNVFARILNGSGSIERIINNYAQISFNIGPTLLSWLEVNAPPTYAGILEADWESRQRFGGHGSALAQAYNHMILPLANCRDKHTQIVWGIRDFERRFGRFPEGFWLPETAVDLETLEILAEQGIRFTILSPYQAARVRPIGHNDWREVGGGHLDPSTAYLQSLPSGRAIALFFYDGPIAQAVAFEKLLVKGEHLANRLLSGFNDHRPWPQLVHIATDGESYGHHHSHGDMALAYALRQIESTPHVRLTNYGEFLDRHPATHEVQILEGTAWSCAHGLERWRSDCGCNSGRPGWNQGWRRPLREALDWLRDELALRFQEEALQLFKDPWATRNAYIDVILDRTPSNVEAFCSAHCPRPLEADDKTRVLKLLEMQRHALLMYTSCGWFFDELSGPETVQVLQYAGRAIQLGAELFGINVEEEFLQLLQRGLSNLPEHRDGRLIYEKFVKPAMIDSEKVGAHFVVSSLFEKHESPKRINCFRVEQEIYQTHEAGKTKLIVGQIKVASEVTQEKAHYSVGATHFGEHNVSAGLRLFQGEEAYQALSRELTAAFTRADFPEIVRLMDRGFGKSTYALGSLFRDEQRKVLRRLLQATQGEVELSYQRHYEQHLPTMRFLANLGAPLPGALQTTAQLILNKDLRWAFEDDEPQLDLIRQLLRDAATWRIVLDELGLSYKLKKTLERIANRLLDQPHDVSRLELLHATVGLRHEVPFPVDLWHVQNVYWQLAQNIVSSRLSQAAAGNETAQVWLKRFLSLGEELNMQTAELARQCSEASQTATVADIVKDVLSKRRIPRAAYRFQLNHTFTFADARVLLGYLAELGISDCYTSPILKAKPGSMHGYDICDHGRINPELGGEEGFEAFSSVLREAGLGFILDIVPNHMGIGHPSNGWWSDVLENGPGSVVASHFDIDWDPVNPDLENKVLLPWLGEQYGTVLEKGDIRLAFENGAFVLYYFDIRLPVAPRTYPLLLEEPADRIARALGSEHDHVLELRSILTALGYLPPRMALPPEKMAERNREKEIIKRRLATVSSSCPELQAAIGETLKGFNGTVGDRRSFDRLDHLLEQQAYRLAYWRVATEEINYRRFFDINELAAIRTELPQVFQATHHLVFRLLAEGKVSGVRVDHPDGLWNPTDYFHHLQENYLLCRARAIAGHQRQLPGIEAEVNAYLKECAGSARAGTSCWPLFVVAEKILGENELLPQGWAVHGTTGYEFLNAVNGLFVDGRHAEAFSKLYDRFIGQSLNFDSMIISSQRMILRVSMTSELNALGHELDRISERNRSYRDFTLNSLTLAVREVIACLFIYRTYITGPDGISERDRHFILEAVERAKLENPRLAEAVFDFVRDTLLLVNLQEFREADRPRVLNWVMKFQQLTGPVIAKALEDTSFYVYNRLASLNEVGGNPSVFGISVTAFHEQNRLRQANWPHSMLTTSTHDTKRSEDVRARINVLSELPDEWEAAVTRWGQMNALRKHVVENHPAPDRNDEYLLYQTLIGAWPVEETPSTFEAFRQRIANYMLKATKEAKVHTSWINPIQEYDNAIRDFVLGILSDDSQAGFLNDIRGFQRRIAFSGYFNSLAQIVLKMTCPGVPDLYQGNELWDFSLVDPDNRRPVDYQARKAILSSLKQRVAGSGQDLCRLAEELLASIHDGRIKLYTIWRTLLFRREQESLFRDGTYLPVQVEGERKNHICALARIAEGRAVLVVVPRLTFGLTRSGERLPVGHDVWGDTWLVLPAEVPSGKFRSIYTGDTIPMSDLEGKRIMRIAEVLSRFPAALLAKDLGPN